MPDAFKMAKNEHFENASVKQFGSLFMTSVKNGNIMMIRKTNIFRLVEQLEKPNLPFWKLDCVLYNFQIQDFYVKCLQDGYF